MAVIETCLQVHQFCHGTLDCTVISANDTSLFELVSGVVPSHLHHA